MKTDKELKRIWTESRYKNNWDAIKEFDALSMEEKGFIFDNLDNWKGDIKQHGNK